MSVSYCPIHTNTNNEGSHDKAGEQGKDKVEAHGAAAAHTCGESQLVNEVIVHLEVRRIVPARLQSREPSLALATHHKCVWMDQCHK
jgi:hypothetical protein